MKKHNRIIAMLLVVMTVLSMMAIPVCAATDSVDCQYSGESGSGSKYLTFSATKTGTASIKFSMLKGYLDPNGWGKTVIVYGSYEIKVRDSNGKVIYDEDAYCTSSKTIKFKVTKNQTYTVQVYFWNATTTAKSYYNKGKMTWKSGSLSQINGSRWWVLPSITAVSSTNGTFKAK